MTLNRSRPIAATMAGLIFQPIPPSEAIALARAAGLDPIDFLRVIADADALYVASLNKQS